MGRVRDNQSISESKCAGGYTGNKATHSLPHLPLSLTHFLSLYLFSLSISVAEFVAEIHHLSFVKNLVLCAAVVVLV